jgi:hypothetical protein
MVTKLQEGLPPVRLIPQEGFRVVLTQKPDLKTQKPSLILAKIWRTLLTIFVNKSHTYRLRLCTQSQILVADS